MEYRVCISVYIEYTLWRHQQSNISVSLCHILCQVQIYSNIYSTAIFLVHQTKVILGFSDRATWLSLDRLYEVLTDTTKIHLPPRCSFWPSLRRVVQLGFSSLSGPVSRLSHWQVTAHSCCISASSPPPPFTHDDKKCPLITLLLQLAPLLVFCSMKPVLKFKKRCPTPLQSTHTHTRTE